MLAQPSKLTGLSLVELLIAVAVMAILAGIGVPSFSHFIDHQRSASLSHLLNRALTTGRAESINRGDVLTVCGAQVSGECIASDIQRILIFIDDNTDGVWQSSELLVAEFPVETASGDMHLNASFGSAFLRFNPDGSSQHAGSFIYCPHSGRASMKRQITLSLTGRSYIRRDSARLTDSYSGYIDCS